MLSCLVRQLGRCESMAPGLSCQCSDHSIEVDYHLTAAYYVPLESIKRLETTLHQEIGNATYVKAFNTTYMFYMKLPGDCM